MLAGKLAVFISEGMSAVRWMLIKHLPVKSNKDSVKLIGEIKLTTPLEGFGNTDNMLPETPLFDKPVQSVTLCVITAFAEQLFVFKPVTV